MNRGPEAPEVRDDLAAMAESAVRMLVHVRDAFTHLDARPLDEAARIGRTVHAQEQALIKRMVRTADGAAPRAAEAEEDAIFVPIHLERIADNIELLGAAVGRMIRQRTLFTDRASREVRRLSATAVELLEGLRDALRTGNRTLTRYVQEAGATWLAEANECALFHEQRLIEGVCVPEASSIYLAMLDHLKGVEWHARQVAKKLAAAGAASQRAG